MRRIRILAGCLCAAVVLFHQPAGAQNQFTLPRVSPAASITQTIGITDITINYHRPGVKDRQIWGGLVPYNVVWRAGANENTTILFSDPVMVNGKKLAAGTYGLHMLPTEKNWTVIFSHQSRAWGSFSYDEKEDAARVTVTPEPIEFQERMSFSFDDPTDGAVTAVLRWEKLKIPFKIEVDVDAVVLANIREELRGLPRFRWQGWQQAAAWCLQHDGNLDEALTWAGRAVSFDENFSTLRTKAGLLEKKGEGATAAGLMEKAMEFATEGELNRYGYELLGQGQNDAAVKIFLKNVTDNPKSWNVYDSLADAYARKGDKKRAMANYKKALELVKADNQKQRIQQAISALE